MTWGDVLKVITSFIVSMGGGGAIVWFVVKLISNEIADRLSKKYDLKLSKELEKYKSGLENKIYISKTRFDAEFKIYRELSLKFAELVKCANVMIPSGYNKVIADKSKRKEYEEECYKNTLNAYTEAQNVLFSNCQFIDEKISDGYQNILFLCRKHIDKFEERYNILDLRDQNEKEKFDLEDYKRTDEINDKWVEQNQYVRSYLSKIDVLEGK